MKRLRKRLRLLRARIQRVKARIAKLAKRGGVSDQTVHFVAEFEGWYPTVYADPAGYSTIGFGHLIGLRPPTEADRRKWGTLTKAQGYELLRGDLGQADAAVRKAVKRPLTAGQRTALTSFVFNVGESAFQSSTLLRLLNSEASKERVAHEFSRWVYAGGKVLPGLARRRKAEADLFLGKDAK